MARYDRYDRGRFSPAFSGWYPGAFWAGAPMYAWDGNPGWPPYLGSGFTGYDRHLQPRPPRYDEPVQGRQNQGPRPRYDAGYDRGYGAGYSRVYAPPRRSGLSGGARMRYDQQHYDPHGARRYDGRYLRSWDRWW